MQQDRRALKSRARELMSGSTPAPWLVTLVFLLATSVLSSAAEWANPVARQIMALSESFQSSYLQMDESTAVTVVMQMQELAQKPAFFVTVLVSMLLTLYSIVVEYGYVSYSLDVVRGEESGVGELFSRFYMAGKIILAQILMVVVIALWALLFIIPGIIAAYRYRMVSYILLDDPDCGVWEAFRRSKAMMQGRKMEYFMLELSFIVLIFGANLLTNLAGNFAGTGMTANIAALAVSTLCSLYLLPYMHLTFAQWYEAVRTGGGAQQQVIDADSFS